MANGRDYVAIATAYAKSAVADKKGKVFGKRFRQGAQRFLDDLKRAKRNGAPFIFDPWHAEDPCDFIEKLPHVEGVWDTPDIVLHPSHVFFLVNLFGFRKPDGTRRFTSALFAVARKNAKSTLASGIMLYCMCCEKEPGAQLLSAATTGSQARIIWRVAKMMADKVSDLREHFGIETWANSISRVETGASFKPINAKASTQDGLNPSHTALDEIHAHKSADLLNVLTSAAGGRKSPLWLYTTTEGYVSPGPWGDIRHFAFQLLDGVFGHDADHFLVCFFCVDKDDKDFDESSWKKANPLWDVNPYLLDEIRKAAIEAKAMPSKLAEFQIKRLNRPAASADGFVVLSKWDACDGEVDLEWLKDKPCFGALDLASTRDLTSFRLVWRVEGKYYTWGRRWVPESAVESRTERGSAPYASWVASGLIEQTEGDVTDYNVIEREVLAMIERFNIQSIAYDRWNAQDLCNRLIDQNAPMIEFVQGGKSYHPAIQELERAYISGNLAHGGDPVLKWCASNLVTRKDQNLNMSPDKKKSQDKIDDMTTLIMAMGVASSGDSGTLDLSDYFASILDES